MSAPLVADVPSSGQAASGARLADAVRGALGALLHLPLTRNGYALAASAGLTSVLGLAFWFLAARLYSADQIGLGAALISVLMTLGNIAQLNLGNVLNRFLPTAGGRAGTLIVSSYAAGAGCALVLSAAFLLVAPLFGPLAFLSDNAWAAAWFVAAAPVWTLFVLQDSALAGLRKATWVPLENVVYSLAKIALLALLFGTGVAALGPFAAWTVPLPAIVLAVNGLIFWRALPASAPGDAGADLTLKRVAGFLGWDYLGTISMMIALGVAPLLVLKVAGAAANANYYLAWSIAYSLYLIGRSMGISLLAEAASDRDRLPALAADAVLHTMVPLVAAAAVLFAGAPFVMALFGPAYAEEGVAILRVLVAATLPWSMITIYLATARARGTLQVVAAVQAATLLLVLGMGAMLLGRMGALGMALAWLAAHSAVAAGLLAICLAKHGPDWAIDWLLRLASSAARFVSALKPADRPAPDPAPELEAMLRRVDEPGAAAWRPLRSLPSQSDGVTVCIGDPRGAAGERLAASPDSRLPQGAEALLKTAVSPQGAASLSRHIAWLERLRSHPALKDWTRHLPRIVAVDRAGSSIRLIESLVHGEEGRSTLRGGARDHALDAAARAIASLHAGTGATATVGEAWLTRWIDEPIALLDRPARGLLTKAQRRAAMHAFRLKQHAFWRGRAVRLGWGHGDFSPGNLIFATAEPADAGACGDAARISIAGITDWDRASPDAPGGLDACHLALTTRMLLSGEELGPVVRRLLHEPFWDQCEASWLGACEGPDGWPHDPAAVEAMVGLAWLHHVAANLDKSGRYAANRMWLAANVDLVLCAYLPKARSRWPSS